MASLHPTPSAQDLANAQLLSMSVPPDMDDLALGFECADPSLQFDAWEPVPASAPTAPMG
jgi:hypothetical protein